MQAGQPEDITQVVANLDAIAAVVNGALDNSNIATSAAILASKLANYPNDASKALLGDGSWGSVGGNPPGTVIYSGAIATPTGYLIPDGSSVSRTTYAALFAALTLSKGTFTVTIASPGVFTLTSHGLVVGDAVYLTTTGALPTGLSPNTTYYVSVVTDANTFQVSATRVGASINTSGTQSGVHTLVLAPHGVPDGNNFWLPDLPGRVVAVRAAAGHADMKALGLSDGLTVTSRRMRHKHVVGDDSPDHTHSFGTSTQSTTTGAATSRGPVEAYNGSNTGASVRHQHPVGPQTGAEPTDMPANIVLNAFIKT